MNFKELPFNKKIEHIWEYYKFHIFGTLFLIVVVCSLLYYMVFNPPKELYAGVGIYGQHVTETAMNNLYSSLNSIVSDTGYEVEITNFYRSPNDPMMDAEMDQKLNTYMFAQQLHLLISNSEDLDVFVSSEYTIPLTEVISEQELSAYDEAGLLHYAIDPVDNTEKPFGISMQNSALIKDNNILEGEVSYISISPMYDNMENTINILRELLK